MPPSDFALCLTPDAAFFKPAIATALSLLDQSEENGFDILLLCEARDVPPDYAALDPSIRARITLQTVDWSPYTRGLPTRAHLSPAVYRRLALHRVLPDRYSRYVAMDSDMLCMRPGIAKLAALDLGGAPFAAAIDMIFWKECDGGTLAETFAAYRARLGLAPHTPYFNNGFTLVDRAAWERMKLSEEALRFLAAQPDACPFLEQSALNAIVRGQFAPLSPRYNFMGDFLQIALEDAVAPIVLHFVNRPKPWEAHWGGDMRFAALYRELLSRTPWPERPSRGPAADTVRPDAPHDPEGFRRRLRAKLAGFAFADGWRVQEPV